MYQVLKHVKGGLMIRQEQKSIGWMLGAQVLWSGDLVVDLCVDTMAIAKSCLRFSEHWRFVRGVKDD